MAALKDSWFSQILLYQCLFTALFSSYSALASVWKLVVYHVLTCTIALNSNFILPNHQFQCIDSCLLSPTWVSLLTFTVQFAGLSFDLVKMEFTRKCKLPLPIPARLLGKVKIIVSLSTVNTVIPTPNTLLGSLTFKTLGLHTLALFGSQEVHQLIAVKGRKCLHK